MFSAKLSATLFVGGPMSLPAESRGTVRFHEFHLELETAELRSNGDKASLQGQPLQILVMLLEHPGRLVTREELKKRLWPSDTFVDFDQSLNRAVNRLREALGDSAEQPRFIETLPRRGYRFIAPVTRSESGEAASSVQVYPSPTNGDPVPRESSLASILPLPSLRWNRKFVTAGLVAGLLILALVGFVIQRRWLRNSGISFDNLEVTKLTDSGKVKNVAISRDGRYAAYAVYVGEKQALHLRQVATRSDVEILPPDLGNFVGLTFSPDGDYIYFVRSDRNDISFRYLYAIPSLGGTPRKLITDVDSGIGFSPDGRQIAYEHWTHNDMELKVANEDGTNQHLITVVHNANFLSPGDPGPTWSPDGSTIAFSKLLVGKQRRWVLYSVSVADGRTRELYSNDTAMGRPLWLPAGDTLLLPHDDRSSRRTQLWTVSFPHGTVRRFTHDISDYSMDLDTTKDGSKIAAITETTQSQIWAASSSEVENVQQISKGDPPMNAVKENDEGKILSTDWDGALWIMNRDGSERTNFGNVQGISWFTICGRELVLTSNERNSTALLRLDEDGTHATKLADGNLWSPTCSKDNRFVYYVNWEQPEKIWRIPVVGGVPIEVAQVLGDSIMGNITVSPDGNFIAYPYSTYTGTSPGRHLAVIPAAGGPPVKLFDMPGDSWNVGPYWTPDSKALQYLLIHDQVSNIWEQSLAGGEPRQVTRFTSGQIFDFTWSADRTRIFLTRGSVSSDVVLLGGFH